MMPIPKYLWADLETTGLHPESDYILEVAAIITDKDLNPLGEPFHSLVWNGLADGEPHHVKRLQLPQNKLALEMHTKNGLLAQLETIAKIAHPMGSIWDRFNVEGQLIEWMDRVVEPFKEQMEQIDPKDRKLILAGSTIGFDRGFFRVWMPAFLSKVSHRSRDVSSDKMLFKDVLDLEFPRAEAHRGMDDVKESLGQAKALRRVLKSMYIDTEERCSELALDPMTELLRDAGL